MRITKMGIILKEDYTAKLVKEYGRNYRGEEKINGARGIVQLMNDVFEMDKQAEEYLYLITMTVKCRPIGFFEVSHGTHNATLAGVREIFVRALLSNAANMIIVHNHPSGISEPSDFDVRLTEKMIMASELIGICFCDHIIIGKDNYYSFYENGYIKQEQSSG